MKPIVRKLKHDILKCPKTDFHEEKQKTRMCKRYLNIRKIYGELSVQSILSPKYVSCIIY